MTINIFTVKNCRLTGYLKSQFKPLSRSHTCELRFLICLDFIETFLLEPAHRLHGPHCGQARQGLWEVRVDRRERRRGDALQVTWGRTVSVLDVVKYEGQRNEDNDDPESNFNCYPNYWITMICNHIRIKGGWYNLNVLKNKSCCLRNHFRLNSKWLLKKTDWR